MAPGGIPVLAGQVAPPPGSRATTLAPSPPTPSGSVHLKLRRQPDAIELVVEGTGATPQLRQSGDGAGWLGQLTLAAPDGLRLGPQRFSIPELGLQSVSLDGSGSSYRLAVTPTPGVPLGRPVVSADGRNLIVSFPVPAQLSTTSARLNLSQPGRLPTPSAAPPLQPRAVAPPLGDIAVGSMVLRNQSFVQLSGPRVSLNLRNAPAIDALLSVARLGGYGFVYVDDTAEARAAQSSLNMSGNAAAGGQMQMSNMRNTAAGRAAASLSATNSGSMAIINQGVPITISFINEDYSRALNSILLAANLQGKLSGRTIFAGPNVLGKSFGSQLSKVYRLNQASAGSAADYLASLGAMITKVNVITNSVSQGTSQANQVEGGPTSQQTTTQRITTTETYGAGTGPLKGLLGTTDSRLQTITLVGDAQLVAIAENYLRQIDLRQRQVALSVQILDVTLDNDTGINNSFAFRFGNNYIINDQGTLVGGFGTTTQGVPSSLPLPTSPSNFYDLVRASILSNSTKVLANPTLILSENSEEVRGGAEAAAQLTVSGGGNGSGSGGSSSSSSGGATTVGVATIGRPRANEAFVTVGEQVVTSYTNNLVGSNSVGTTTQTFCQPEFGIAGLTFGARVSKIDDNGFVTFTLSPQISAEVRAQLVQGCGNISILNVRRLDTGSARVRDGQTLILTGVISDLDRQVVTKWPILGDIPLVGQFFRNSSGSRRKRELVILVTPRILEDGQGGGYGFRPATPEARQLLGG